MIFYDVTVNYKLKKELPKYMEPFDLEVNKNDENYVSKWKEKVRSLNIIYKHRRILHVYSGIYIYDAKPGNLQVIVSETVDWCKTDGNDNLDVALPWELEVGNMEVTKVQAHEITAELFNLKGIRGEENGFIRSWGSEAVDERVDYFSNKTFRMEEKMIGHCPQSIEDAINESVSIMGSKSLNDELKRIYSKSNRKVYGGNPVHYKISVSDKAVADDIVYLLLSSLKKNERIVSNRVTRIYDIGEDCYGEKDVVNIFRAAEGGAIVIELGGLEEENGNYATAYHEVVDFYLKLIKKFNLYTLCVFVEIQSKPGISRSLLSKAQDYIDLIEIEEGSGDRDTAIAYFKSLIKDSHVRITDKQLDKYIGNKEEYTMGEVYSAFQNWTRYRLQNVVYREYKKTQKLKVERYDARMEAYEELNEMIGLQEVKGIVNDIIDTFNVRKMRKDAGLPVSDKSLHMVFTGNPGSAKTTVARLMAEILRRDEILESGAFVECGRGDLVGKYVGWTAKAVRAKFREASGGILFIDEAYALLDSSNSFGDEAINTIVQEMENRRDDVIVIFSGYTKRMDEFLMRNEGLNSRIAFHLNFPDYKPDELCQILELMAKKRNFRIDRSAYEKCHEIFKRACVHKDFGNGRFVRNLLDQAEMAQARRIMAENKDRRITKEELQLLVSEDFDVNIGKFFKDKTVIGFNS